MRFEIFEEAQLSIPTSSLQLADPFGAVFSFHKEKDALLKVIGSY